MDRNGVTVPESATCAERLKPSTKTTSRSFPWWTQGNRGDDLAAAPGRNLRPPRVSTPKLMRHVHGTLADIVRGPEGDRRPPGGRDQEECYVRLGTMDIGTFWKISEKGGFRVGVAHHRRRPPRHPTARDRARPARDHRDEQARRGQGGRRAGPRPGGQHHQQPARLVADVQVVRTASSIERVVQRQFGTVTPTRGWARIRRKISTCDSALVVLDEGGTLAGVLSKERRPQAIRTRLVLVDHNEITQAVIGADEVQITEIIDHHRLGPDHHAGPHPLHKRALGSTCTIVADLFRAGGVPGATSRAS